MSRNLGEVPGKVHKKLVVCRKRKPVSSDYNGRMENYFITYQCIANLVIHFSRIINVLIFPGSFSGTTPYWKICSNSSIYLLILVINHENTGILKYKNYFIFYITYSYSKQTYLSVILNL